MSAKIVTYDDLKEHTVKGSMWILLSGKVYDVTKFMDEHPGGDEVITAESGRDATETFEDIGHSDEARNKLPAMLVGEFEKDSELKVKVIPPTIYVASEKDVQPAFKAMYFIPVGILVAYFVWRFCSS